jgi:CelD/BcsL family acetyltransferase involved in cellulose biosynthesis
VAVIEEGGRAVGFLPFYRGRGGVAEPVVHSLTDFQGALVQPGVEWSLDGLLRGCGLKALHWDHVAPGQGGLEAHRRGASDSPFMDVSQGFEHYQNSRAQPHGHLFSQALRKLRKAERQFGPLRFEPYCGDPELLRTMIAWKTAQYFRTHTRNVFNRPWVADLLERVQQTNDARLRGALSVLYLGDEVAALHFGMVSGGVLHSWFPTYRVELSKWSPGLLLLLCLARDAETLGLRRIDLGRGPEPYKREFMTGAIPLTETHLDRRVVGRLLRGAWLTARRSIVASPLETPARLAWFGARRLLGLRHTVPPPASDE